MQKLIFAVIGGVAAYMLVNFVLGFVLSDPRHILYLLSPAAAAIVADLWHARVAPIFSLAHLTAVYAPVLVMFLVQTALVAISGAQLGGTAYYLGALGVYLLAATVAFAVSAFVRTVLFNHSYDPDEAELSSYSAARIPS